MCLALAHLCFSRKLAKRWITRGRPNGRLWSLSIIIVSVTVAAVAGVTSLKRSLAFAFPLG